MRKLFVPIFTLILSLTLITPVFASHTGYYGEYCTGQAECLCIDFYDLNPQEWYHFAIDFVIHNRYMKGYGNERFGPNDAVNKAQLIQIIYNMAGHPSGVSGYQFSDVPTRSWCYKAVSWAVGEELISAPGGYVGADDAVTREEAISVLYNYAKSHGHGVSNTTNIGHFTDSQTVSGYAYTPISWAVAEGIIAGNGNNELKPYENLTRAQLAQILYKYGE